MDDSNLISLNKDPKKWVVHCKKFKYDVYIGRPSKYGNPFSHKPDSVAKWIVGSINEAVEKHKEWFLNNPELMEDCKRELKGKILGCWGCTPCHGYILAKVANDL